MMMRHKKIVFIALLFFSWFAGIKKASAQQRYNIAAVDLMMLKRQKLGAIPLASQVGVQGLELDMGGLGNRPTFDNQLLNDSIRAQFMQQAKNFNISFCSLSMSGYYAQSFCGRENFLQSIEDCIRTMKLMNVKVGFLPMGVQCD